MRTIPPKPPTAAFVPQPALPPSQRGDTGKAPLPKTRDGGDRHVNTERKIGGGPKGLKGE